MAKYLNLKLSIKYLENESDNNINKLTEHSLTHTLPLLQEGQFFLSGIYPIAKYLLYKDFSLVTVLHGKDSKEICQVEMWDDFLAYQIWPLYDHTIGQITGKTAKNEEIFRLAVEDLTKILQKLNNHLGLRSFMVGYNVTLADLAVTTALHPFYSLLLDEKTRKNFPNVTRLFLFVSNLSHVTSVLGKARLCKVAQKPANISLTASVNNDKDNKPEVKSSKENKKPETTSKPTQAPTNTNTSAPEEEKQKKKTNPLDALPPSNFDFDQFKKDFLNTTEKKAVLDDFWKNKFDPAGYSVWFVHYNRRGDQGKVGFKTKNLKSNFLQVI